jgi:hypothetical protein
MLSQSNGTEMKRKSSKGLAVALAAAAVFAAAVVAVQAADPDDRIGPGQTTIAVKDGVVRLTGEAASDGHKALTAESAADITGVTSVQNEMTIAEVVVY